MPAGRRAAVDLVTDGAELPAVDIALVRELARVVPAGVGVRATDRLMHASDASHYRLVPQAVVTPRDVEQLAATVRTAAEHGATVTFRSGGTSLSGQAVGSGILLDTRRHFRAIEVLDEGLRVRVQPGATVRAVNARLAPYGRKLGPDPASETACTIGGVVANNSSGMTCGTQANAYRTVDSLLLVLVSGIVLDTGAAGAEERLRQLEPELHAGLLGLRDQIRSSSELRRRIEQQFALKNTMGYSLNAFLDHDSAVRILQSLVVGSEGTLAFVAEVTLRTLPVHPHVATGLLVFDDLRGANDALPALVDEQLAAIELLDSRALKVAQRDLRAPSLLRELDVDRQAALLIEHQELTAQRLAERTLSTEQRISALLGAPLALRTDPDLRAALWHIRKGLYAAVAGARPSGTTALLEDVAVPPAALAVLCERLEHLFVRHGYHDSVIFGHAKDGNVHFLLNERFEAPGRLRTYEHFTEDLVELVLSLDGTLKAEHGTGRVMAPFVQRQFGAELYDVMRQVKRLLDPRAVLNPGIVLSADPRAHLQHLKASVVVEPEVDRCVACGFCEPVCPSRDLTTTPRQRILLRRELAMAEQRGDATLAGSLREEYRYDALQTCAADGMCQTACPVDINTADLVRRLRAEQLGAFSRAAGRVAAGHWSGVTRLAAAGLTVADTVPAPLPRAATAALRRAVGHERVPQWDEDLPRGGTPRTAVLSAHARAVLLPSCTGAMFGAGDGEAGVTQTLLALCARAGVPVRVPPAIDGLCCGTPWKSKGLTDGYAVMRSRVQEALLDATEHGRLPVVVDASSCTEGLVELLAEHTDPAIEILDAVTFARTTLLPGLQVRSRLPRLALHPTCSTTRAGIDADLLAIADLVAEQVVVPDGWGCCAFAGDRGLLHPELTAIATATYAAAVVASGATDFASCNRTCELGMSRATGQPYRHLLQLLEQVTRNEDPS